MLSTKRETLISVMATRLHLIDNMFSAVIELLSASSADGTSDTLRCDTEQKTPSTFIAARVTASLLRAE